MSARTEILDRIHGALSDRPEVPTVPRGYRAESELDEAELIRLLIDRLVDYKAQVSVADHQDVSTRINELLAGTSSYVVPSGLDPDWLTTAEGDDRRRRMDSIDAPLGISELDDIDTVITGSAVSVAETGTIILDGSPNQGRRVISLVPDHHICVVRAGDIVGILPEALRRLDGTRPITMISGPSATSDIELERVEGVHGPRRLDVIIAR
ncbi:lactate utilization protein C [Arthrobacter sp. NPDC057259]|uniref:LutC/YkgG family protein n=1 Tax=Arthrobacter sp. NPDC057259 TaxID=3346073 RepID=UPI003641D7EF